MRLAAALLVCATPAVAGEFVPPAGCETWLTVQLLQCRVSNHYRCAQDAPGDQRRADFDTDGLVFLSRIDAETQWLESFSVRMGLYERLDPGPSDPASFSELLRTGEDRFDFTETGSDGSQTRTVGSDRLTGRFLVIDGVELQETAYEAQQFDKSGQLIVRMRGTEYAHHEWRRFFSGPTERDYGDGFVAINRGPVAFIFPGQPGFAATRPVHGCDAAISALPEGGPHVADQT